ncbi:hypothetical protein [Streptomyces sp. NPDC057438]|uniref:hypothetical protein n=1 Tax=Streptomyces sp. NPDC057438 TaxID=3346133 RepID=UPI00367794AC
MTTALLFHPCMTATFQHPEPACPRIAQERTTKSPTPVAAVRPDELAGHAYGSDRSPYRPVRALLVVDSDVHDAALGAARAGGLRGTPFRAGITALEEDLIAARTSLRRMIRTENTAR